MPDLERPYFAFSVHMVSKDLEKHETCPFQLLAIYLYDDFKATPERRKIFIVKKYIPYYFE